MTCEDVREYLFAFLDGELDAPLSIEFQRHIEHCPGCAREVEIERAIRRSIVVAVDTGPVGGFAMPRLEEPSPISKPVGNRSARKRWGWLSMGLAALIALCAWVWLSPLSVRPTASLPDHLVSDFEHFMADGRTVQEPSSDPEVVSRWLRAQTDVPIQLASAAPSGWRLLGGRKCEIAGKSAAFAGYARESDQATASVVGMVGSAAALEGMRVIRRGDETHWAMRCRGHTVLACERAGVIYAAVSDLPEEELAALMQGAKPTQRTEP